MKTMLRILMLAGLASAAGFAFDDGGGGGKEKDFMGAIQSLPPGGMIGDWMVAGTTVHVMMSTEIKDEKGPAVVGACVEVKGQLMADSSVTATEIETRAASDCGQQPPQGGGSKPVEIDGAVQSLPASGMVGDWQVGGRTVHVFPTTEINQEESVIAVGVCVEVQGQAQADTSINAATIEVKSASACGGTPKNPVEFQGLVQTLPASGLAGDWKVAGRVVHVTGTTEVKQEKGSIIVGSCVEVKGQLQGDSSITASEIDLEPAAACGVVPENPVEFEGTVKSLPATGLVGDWQIDTRTLHVFANTKIDQERGPVATGSCVEVKGQAASDGSVDATEIEVRSGEGGCGEQPDHQDTELQGTVQKLPTSGLTGDWQVSGQTVHVLSSTQIQQEDGAIIVGSCVKVQGVTQADGSINATEIDPRSASKCSGTMGGVETDFKGTVQTLPASGLTGDWQVSGRTVHVLSTTSVDSSASFGVGSCVEINGELQADQSIDAQSIELKPSTDCLANVGATSEVSGLVQSLPTGGSLVGDWQVGTTTVHVLAGTSIDQEHGAVVLGACVEVKGTLLPDQSMNAISVEVTSMSGTCFSKPGVVDAASFSSGNVSPGELISLFGLRLGPAGSATLQLTPDGNVSTTLSGVRVLFDGQPAPMLAVTGQQVNAVVPFGVAGKVTTQIQIENGGVWSNSVTVPVAEAHPGLFTSDGTGTHQAAALNQDGSLNSATRPAARGSIVVLYATGAGIANQGLQDGQMIADANVKPALPVSVTIGGANAEVMFAGMAPRMVAGVLQVNARIPANAPTGDAIPVLLKIGGFSSSATVTLAVQ